MVVCLSPSQIHICKYLCFQLLFPRICDENRAGRQDKPTSGRFWFQSSNPPKVTGVNISSLNQTSICISGFSCQQNQLLDLFLTRSSTTLFFLVTGGYFTTTKSFSRNIKTDLILLNFETPDRDQATFRQISPEEKT